MQHTHTHTQTQRDTHTHTHTHANTDTEARDLASSQLGQLAAKHGLLIPPGRSTIRLRSLDSSPSVHSALHSFGKRGFRGPRSAEALALRRELGPATSPQPRGDRRVDSLRCQPSAPLSDRHIQSCKNRLPAPDDRWGPQQWLSRPQCNTFANQPLTWNLGPNCEPGIPQQVWRTGPRGFVASYKPSTLTYPRMSLHEYRMAHVF